MRDSGYIYFDVGSSPHVKISVCNAMGIKHLNIDYRRSSVCPRASDPVTWGRSSSSSSSYFLIRSKTHRSVLWMYSDYLPAGRCTNDQTSRGHSVANGLSTRSPNGSSLLHRRTNEHWMLQDCDTWSKSTNRLPVRIFTPEDWDLYPSHWASFDERGPTWYVRTCQCCTNNSYGDRLNRSCFSTTQSARGSSYATSACFEISRSCATSQSYANAGGSERRYPSLSDRNRSALIYHCVRHHVVKVKHRNGLLVRRNEGGPFRND